MFIELTFFYKVSISEVNNTVASALNIIFLGTPHYSSRVSISTISNPRFSNDMNTVWRLAMRWIITLLASGVCVTISNSSLASSPCSDDGRQRERV